MSATDAILALFVQPEFGVPVLLLVCSVVAWWSWESSVLPPALAPYSLRRPWELDTVRLLHEALSADRLGPTIQATYTWLSQEFYRRYGTPISRFVRFGGYFLRNQVPNRPRFRRAVRTLQSAFFEAQYAEDTSPAGWFAKWRRPRARTRAQRIFVRALVDLEALESQLGGRQHGSGT